MNPRFSADSFLNAMMGALLVGIPIAVAFNLVLDRFIEGLTGVGPA